MNSSEVYAWLTVCERIERVRYIFKCCFCKIATPSHSHLYQHQRLKCGPADMHETRHCSCNRISCSICTDKHIWNRYGFLWHFLYFYCYCNVMPHSNQCFALCFNSKWHELQYAAYTYLLKYFALLYIQFWNVICEVKISINNYTMDRASQILIVGLYFVFLNRMSIFTDTVLSQNSWVVRFSAT